VGKFPLLFKFVMALGFVILPRHLAAQDQPSDRFESNGRAKIVGGDKASIRDWPWIASLRYVDEQSGVSGHVCGGAVAAPEWIITAAHCLVELQHGSTLRGGYPDDMGEGRDGNLQVVLGVDELHQIKPENIYAVSSVKVHEDFLEAFDKALVSGMKPGVAVDHATITSGADIAIIKLARPWNGAIAPLSLSSETDPQTPPGTDVRVAGFGFWDPEADKRRMYKFARSGVDFFAGTAQLMDVKVPTVETGTCLEAYKGAYPKAAIGEGQICAGTKQGQRDSCQGDSGGPLVAFGNYNEKYQIGVVSWGSGCAKPGWPGIYTRLSYRADWLKAHIPALTQYHPSRAVGGQSSNSGFAAAALQQIADELKPAQGRVAIHVPGGTRVTIGNRYSFEVTSKVSGRLVIIDIDANQEIRQILPNEYTKDAAGFVQAEQKIIVPPRDGSWDFTAFEARDPPGKGTLLAIVVPNDFPIRNTITANETLRQRSNGWQPVSAASYMMNFIEQISLGVAADRAAGKGQSLERWGWSRLDYEIARPRR